MEKKVALVFIIITWTSMFNKSQCHSSGAPTGQCENMTPNHGTNAQTGASPYEIKVKKPYYMPMENVKVSIESSSDNIKGYLIQARQVGANTVIGTFGTRPVNGQYLNCGNSKVELHIEINSTT